MSTSQATPHSPVLPTRYFIDDGIQPMPVANRVIFADGSANSSFRSGLDLELSHWVPTSTPSKWAADTSTEICFRFVDDHAADDVEADRYDLAVNNHIDVDGVLSLFVLLHPATAQKYRQVVIAAAEHGDFQASAPEAALVLAQELTPLVNRAYLDQEPLQELFAEGFALTTSVLGGTHQPSAAAKHAHQEIERCLRLLDDGDVATKVVSEHLVFFVLPALSGHDLDRALRVPQFSAIVDDSVWLWPHARNRDHGERAQLVSIPTTNDSITAGWFHDLWLPGYAWAHTPDRWTVPWLEPTGGSNEWSVRSPALDAAIESLTSSESNEGLWSAAGKLTPFSTMVGRGFPVVASFTDVHGIPTPSSLKPEIVASTLATVFTS